MTVSLKIETASDGNPRRYNMHVSANGRETLYENLDNHSPLRMEAVRRGAEFRASGAIRPTREDRTRICTGCGVPFLVDAASVADTDEAAGACWECL